MKVIDKSIDMIAYFYNEKNTNKIKVKPIRFRLTDENGEKQVFKIEKISEWHEEKGWGQSFLIFTCQIVINGLQKICEIRFYNSTMTWKLFKI